MIKKLAFVISQTNISQKCDLLFDCLNHVSQTTDIDVALYRCDVGKLIKIPLFACFNIEDLWSFDGVAIAIDLFSAKKMLVCPQPIKKYFYIQDIEWQMPNLNYNYLTKVYQNPDLELITRGKAHHQLIKQCWNRENQILESFNPNNIIQLVQKTYGHQT